MKHSRLILPIIVISQFCCTSLWFAGNGVMEELLLGFNLETNALGHLTSAVQFGFITGTFIFAMLCIADRFAPAKVFLVCAILGALFNGLITVEENNFTSLLILRFLIGFFLAGIYPVGMKIAADHFEKGLGRSLGFLVGALVIGTAFPHLSKELFESSSWKFVLTLSSLLAIFGGTIMFLFVPNGPYRKAGSQVDFRACIKVFENRKFKASAFGYFGHMWELYAFWTFVPFMLKTYNSLHSQAEFNISMNSFIVIAIGGLACALGAYLAEVIGTKKVAFFALLLSCSCCLLSPFLFASPYKLLFLIYLIFWGMVVIADSPLFSTMVAQNTNAETKGTALTIVNCIGFAITICSIQLLNTLSELINPINIYLILAIGPILGLIALKKQFDL